MVTLIAAGMCEIVASQAGDQTYRAAPSVTQLFSVAPDLAGAPHLVSVSVSNKAITAKFRAPSYLGGSAVSAYRLEAEPDYSTPENREIYVNPGCSAAGSDLVCDMVGMPLTRMVDGEEVRISYTVRVAAVTAAGVGNFSNASAPVTPGSTDIAVMRLSADQVQGQLEVSWEQPLALDDNFDRYEVFVWPVNTPEPEQPTESISSVTTESTSFTMAAATPQVALFSLLSQSISIPQANSYNLKVVTITDSSAEELTDINVASGIHLGLGAPGRPRNELLEADSQQLRVVWSEPNFDGGDEVTHYMVRKAGADAPLCEIVDPSTSPATGEIDESWNYSLNDPSALLFQQGGLVAGSSYEIAIYACNSIGASAPAILTHSIPAPPPPPAPAATGGGIGGAATPEVTPVKPVAPKPEVKPAPKPVTVPGAKPGSGSSSQPAPSPSPSDLLAPDESETPEQTEVPGEPQGSADSGGSTSDEVELGAGQGSESDDSVALAESQRAQNTIDPLLLIAFLAMILLLMRFIARRTNREQN